MLKQQRRHILILTTRAAVAGNKLLDALDPEHAPVIVLGLDHPVGVREHGITAAKGQRFLNGLEVLAAGRAEDDRG
jgi:myo-inositol catabolism protein IolC